MKTYIILNWTIPQDIGLIIDEEGNPMFFDTVKEAQDYAEKELNGEWKVIGIDFEKMI